MRVTANAVIEDGVAIAHCDNCGAEFYRSRSDHRFCSITCHHEFHINERRAALQAWRQQDNGAGKPKPLSEILETLKERTEPQVQAPLPRRSW